MKINLDRQTESNGFERHCCETCWTRATAISLREILSLKTTCYCKISISWEAILMWNTTTETCTVIKAWSFIIMKNCKNSKVAGKLTFLVPKILFFFLQQLLDHVVESSFKSCILCILWFFFHRTICQLGLLFWLFKSLICCMTMTLSIWVKLL